MSDQPTQPVASKQCTKCGAVKALDEFYKNNTTRDGKNFSCRICDKKRRRRYYKANSDWLKRISSERQAAERASNPSAYAAKNAAIYRKRRKENRSLYLYYSAKKNAKAGGLEFDLEKADFAIPAICVSRLVPLDLEAHGLSDNAPSNDRIDSSKGYIKGNHRIISWLANRLKNNGRARDLNLVAKDVLRLETNAAIASFLDAVVIEEDKTVNAISSPVFASKGTAGDTSDARAADNATSGSPAQGDAAACDQSDMGG